MCTHAHIRMFFLSEMHIYMFDEYDWINYRSYYRCTHQGCNVKKQVHRLTKNEGEVVTTYEGVHTHPIEKTTDNFEHILSQMHIYTPF